MKELKYPIKDEQGIHARPAGMRVMEASKFESSITIESAGKTGDAKKIFSVMSLGVKCGNEITIKADGVDEAQAISAIEDFLSKNL